MNEEAKTTYLIMVSNFYSQNLIKYASGPTAQGAWQIAQDNPTLAGGALTLLDVSAQQARYVLNNLNLEQ